MRTPQLHGGPGSFQSRLETELSTLGCLIYHHKKFRFDRIGNIIVFSSTKHLLFLIYQKLIGSKIILRLDGLNKKHRYNNASYLLYVYSELDNLLSACIANFLSDTIIYQSEYVKKCWEKSWIKFKRKSYVVYNGVNIESYAARSGEPKVSDVKICVVEGAIDDFVGVKILNSLAYRVDVYSAIAENIRNQINNDNVRLIGLVNREVMPKLLTEYNVFLLLEVNPACPNSLIEAMAAGLIPVGFRTGSVGEILGETDVFMADYGSNSEKYEMPNLNSLNAYIEKAIASASASQIYRARADTFFNIKTVAQRYIEIVKG